MTLFLDGLTKVEQLNGRVAQWLQVLYGGVPFRGGSRAAAASKMKRFAIICNGWTKRSILDVAAALGPLLPLGSIIS